MVEYIYKLRYLGDEGPAWARPLSQNKYVKIYTYIHTHMYTQFKK